MSSVRHVSSNVKLRIERTDDGHDEEDETAVLLNVAFRQIVHLSLVPFILLPERGSDETGQVDERQVGLSRSVRSI